LAAWAGLVAAATLLADGALLAGAAKAAPTQPLVVFWASDPVRPNEAVVISLVTDGVNFSVEVHNPTGKAITCTLRGAPGFAPLCDYRKAVRLPPYSSVVEKIQSRPGTVKLEPIR
jgi:hypothetical protein